MEGCCSVEVIVCRVCGCNAKDRKRNSEIVPLLSCNWALVVPPRANSSLSNISFVFRQWLPLLSSLLLLRNRTKRFRQKFATFCFRVEIRRLKTADRFWGGGDIRICRVKKTCGSAGGSTSTSKTDVTERSCCKKQFEKKKLCQRR